MQKGAALENLQYADGKERDKIDQIEAQEKLLGTDKVSPFERLMQGFLKENLVI